TNQHFLAWHIEERQLSIAACEEDTALALYNMICIAINGNDKQHAREALKKYDQLGTSYFVNEVNAIRKAIR
ncbi:MAG: hypothetical protein IJU05_07320, partial [Schwartzia sp.]|nr:hypothetical protein [Schwartzia sp. (in: firmicutes)]